MEHSLGKIFLSEQRGQIQGTLFQRNCTFNFETYFNEHKEAIGSLFVFNEETLLATAQISMKVDKASYIILIPITGDLRYIDPKGNPIEVSVGQAMISKNVPDQLFGIENPYNTEVITFIQIRIAATELNNFSNTVVEFDPSSSVNQLISLCNPDLSRSNPPFKLTIGQFDGRAESSYDKQHRQSQLFCYVIAGAFEVEGRLLHAQDSLALWDTDSIEMEALSNNALILTVETS